MNAPKHIILATTLSFLVVAQAQAATPWPMASGNYFESFTGLGSWTGGFTSPTEATRWGSVSVNNSGTIPDGQKIITATGGFTSGSTGGVQNGGGIIVLLSTGTGDNTNSTAIDLYLDFTGKHPGMLSFDWVSLTNITGNRASSLRVYTSTNGTTFTELAGASVLNLSNNVVASGTIANVQLPADFNNCPTARIRFYEYNGTGGNTGNRAKIGIDNVGITNASTLTVVVTNLASSGAGTLRQAILDSISGDTIIFTNTLSGSNIVLTGSQLSVNKSLIIDASALPSGIQISGNHQSRVFEIASNAVVTLASLTISNGYISLGVFPDNTGGGILNRGTLTLTNCTIANNSAPVGGGIENYYATLIIHSSTFSSNSASSVYGGGIHNFIGVGAVTLNQCTMVGNTAVTTGGAIHHFHDIDELGPSGLLIINQSTFAGNSANTGGGIYVEGESFLTISNSIIAGNSVSASDTNLSLGVAFFTAKGVNLTNGSPLLASLGNYGGLTQTMPPLHGSPAIDGCTNGSGYTTDQRGLVRPLGLAADIGAVEGVFNPAGPGQLTSVTRLGNGSLRFAFTNSTDASFTVLASTNLTFPLSAWSNLGTAVEAPPGSGQFSFTDPQATNSSQRFYRVRTP